MSRAEDSCLGRGFCVEVHDRHRQSNDDGPCQFDCFRAASSRSDQALRKSRGGDHKPVTATEGMRHHSARRAMVSVVAIEEADDLTTPASKWISPIRNEGRPSRRAVRADQCSSKLGDDVVFALEDDPPRSVCERSLKSDIGDH